LNGIGSTLEYKSKFIIHLKITTIVHTISVYICMDRNWINSPCNSDKYKTRVEEFIQFA